MRPHTTLGRLRPGIIALCLLSLGSSGCLRRERWRASEMPDTADVTAALSIVVSSGLFAFRSEYGATIAFLPSDDAGYITGTGIPIDGGYLAT